MAEDYKLLNRQHIQTQMNDYDGVSSKPRGKLIMMEGHSRLIEADGRRLANGSTYHVYDEMSHETKRLSTFERFPLKNIIMKLYESGFFYTGDDDTTTCHRCHATVRGWTEDDDPRIYHQLDCVYRSHVEQINIDESQSHREFSSSILDEPICDSNVQVPLSPTVLSPAPHFETNPTLTEDNLPHPVPSSFPFGLVYVKQHSEMLGSINLFSEEDRRKTFLFNNSWKTNTNDVLPYEKLAGNGFFYLGNLNRTQCFSCEMVFNRWYREDNGKIALIHKKNSKGCKMARGEDPRNVPFQNPHSFHQLSLNITDESSLEISPDIPPHLSPATRSSHTQPSNSQPSVSHLSASAVQFSSESRTQESIQNSGLGLYNMVVEPTHSPSPAVRTSNAAHIPQGNDLDYVMTDRQAAPIHHPIQVSEEATEPEPTEPEDIRPPFVHVNSATYVQEAGQNEEIYHEISDPVFPIHEDAEEQDEPMQLGNEWASAFPCDDPQYPDMRNLSNRLQSFTAYWHDNVVGNVNEIAQAGFYCFVNNRTRCWYCGCSGHEWMPYEDPWEIHAGLSPNCDFLLRQKGLDYVSDISSRRPQTPASPLSPESPESPWFRRRSFSSSASEGSPFSSMEISGLRGSNLPHITIVGGNVIGGRYSQGRQTQPPRVVDPREEEAKRTRLLQTSLDSEISLSAVEMGFDLPMIKRVIKRKIWRTDETYASPSALLDDLLHPPVDLDSDSDDDGDEMQENATGNAARTSEEPSSSGSVGNGDDEGGEAAGGNSSTSMDPKQMGDKLREFELEKRCKVCLDRDADVVFIPCGHLCTCVECAHALRTCPLCRKRIQKSIKTYTS